MKLRTLGASLFVRITLILLAGLIAAQAVSLRLQWGERASVVAQARGLHFSDGVAEAVRRLEAAAPAQRAAVMAALRADGIDVQPIAASEVSAFAPRGQMQAMLAARVGSEHEVRTTGGGGRMMPMHGNAVRSFDVRLHAGDWVRISAPGEAPAPAFSSTLIVQLLAMLAIVMAIVVFAVRQVTKPLQQLAHAADHFGNDLAAPPLAEAGPLETRRAASAFNRMQAKIKRLVDERSRALAAVSHDLRTPLTRLRLRSELIADDRLRGEMASDLEAMSAMLDMTLDYLRGLEESEPVRRIDVNALVQSIAEDAAVLGRGIAVEGQAQAPYSGRLSALRRALQNLIDNAFKYGQSARLRVIDDERELCLVVEDEGPGIASAELERVQEPYYRSDAARSSESGGAGVGLGLSIVRHIALLHGGRLELSNRAQGGLAASLVLPRKAAP